ncbi:MAG: glycosyltransferase family 4 protein, partial [Cytophagales bacterium]|nr:glycosyltransferase family 4 protein [Cytophagales bacterium]
MKILFCTNAFENVTNGPAKFAHLILEINKQYPEHEVHILTEDTTQENEYVHRVPLRIPKLLKPLGQVLRMFIYYKKAKQIRELFPFDVIVYNNAYTGLWASLVSRRPTVGMINDEKNIRATLAAFQPNRWWLKQFFFRQLERASMRTHRLIITNSEFLKKRVEQAYSTPANKVHRLYKSIDLQAITYQPERIFAEPVKILFVKADYRVGNLHVLVQALARLPLHQFRLTVIGPELRFEADLRKFFQNVHNVELNYLGPQSQQVVYEHLRTEDIFCVPSNTEALGVANIEALAHGIPVISSRVGGIPEVLAEGENGWLVQPNDA